jgi:hypothetical protein
LHYLVVGACPDQAEAEALYGPTFDWLDAYTTPEANPHNFKATWATHRAAIEAHADRLGITTPWIACVLERDGLLEAAEHERITDR